MSKNVANDEIHLFPETVESGELRTKFRRTVIRDSPVSTYCAKCGTKAAKKCSGCKIARYCSTTCQQSDWKEHKLLCRNVYDRVALIVSPGLTTAEVDAMLEKCKADAEAEIEAAVVANLQRLGNETDASK